VSEWEMGNDSTIVHINPQRDGTRWMEREGYLMTFWEWTLVPTGISDRGKYRRVEKRVVRSGSEDVVGR